MYAMSLTFSILKRRTTRRMHPHATLDRRTVSGTRLRDDNSVAPPCRGWSFPQRAPVARFESGGRSDENSFNQVADTFVSLDLGRILDWVAFRANLKPWPHGTSVDRCPFPNVLCVAPQTKTRTRPRRPRWLPHPLPRNNRQHSTASRDRLADSGSSRCGGLDFMFRGARPRFGAHGRTLDKFRGESGFRGRCRFRKFIERWRPAVRDDRAAEQIAPAYTQTLRARDVNGTVESLTLFCSSLIVKLRRERRFCARRKNRARARSMNKRRRGVFFSRLMSRRSRAWESKWCRITIWDQPLGRMGECAGRESLRAKCCRKETSGFGGSYVWNLRPGVLSGCGVDRWPRPAVSGKKKETRQLLRSGQRCEISADGALQCGILR